MYMNFVGLPHNARVCVEEGFGSCVHAQRKAPAMEQNLRNVQQNEDGSTVSCDRCNKRHLYCTITDGFRRTAKPISTT